MLQRTKTRLDLETSGPQAMERAVPVDELAFDSFVAESAGVADRCSQATKGISDWVDAQLGLPSSARRRKRPCRRERRAVHKHQGEVSRRSPVPSVSWRSRPSYARAPRLCSVGRSPAGWATKCAGAVNRAHRACDGSEPRDPSARDGKRATVPLLLRARA